MKSLYVLRQQRLEANVMLFEGMPFEGMEEEIKACRLVYVVLLGFWRCDTPNLLGQDGQVSPVALIEDEMKLFRLHLLCSYLNAGKMSFSRLFPMTVKTNQKHDIVMLQLQPYASRTQQIACATLAQDILEGRAQISDAHKHNHQPLIFLAQSLIGGSVTNYREQIDT
ncbi:hypothetical protein ACFE04_021468 [Oxalis oulophora]